MSKDPKLAAYLIAENEMDTEDFVELVTEDKRACDLRFILSRLLINPTVIDDHDGESTTISGVLLTDENYVVPIYPNNGFCLNPLYLDEDDNNIHLSPTSVGGTFRRGAINDPEAITRYNKECGSMLKAGNIKTVIWFY